MKVAEIVLESRAEDRVGYRVGKFSLLIIGSYNWFGFKRFIIVVVLYRRYY